MIYAGKLFDGMKRLRDKIKEMNQSENSEIQVAILNNVLYVGCNSGRYGRDYEIIDHIPTPSLVNEWISAEWYEPDENLKNIQKVVFCKPENTHSVMHAEMNIIHYLHRKNVPLTRVMYLVGSKLPCVCCGYIIDYINANVEGFGIEIPDASLIKANPETNPSEWTNPFADKEKGSFPVCVVNALSPVTKETITR